MVSAGLRVRLQYFGTFVYTERMVAFEFYDPAALRTEIDCQYSDQNQVAIRSFPQLPRKFCVSILQVKQVRKSIESSRKCRVPSQKIPLQWTV